MTYLDPRYRRIDEPVSLNMLEREAGKLAALKAGKQWGVLKRELINAGVRRLLEELDAQPTADKHGV